MSIEGAALCKQSREEQLSIQMISTYRKDFMSKPWGQIQSWNP